MVQFILDPSAVNGDHSPIPEQQFHASGAHVEFASSCIILHVCVLSALRHSHSDLSCFLMIRSGTFFDGSKRFILFSNEYKKSEPFSYRKKFGFCCCGAPPGTRTLGPLIKRASRRFVSIYGSFESSLFLIKAM